MIPKKGGASTFPQSRGVDAIVEAVEPIGRRLSRNRTGEGVLNREAGPACRTAGAVRIDPSSPTARLHSAIASTLVSRRHRGGRFPCPSQSRPGRQTFPTKRRARPSSSAIVADPNCRPRCSHAAEGSGETGCRESRRRKAYGYPHSLRPPPFVSHPDDARTDIVYPPPKGAAPLLFSIPTPIPSYRRHSSTISAPRSAMRRKNCQHLTVSDARGYVAAMARARIDEGVAGGELSIRT